MNVAVASEMISAGEILVAFLAPKTRDEHIDVMFIIPKMWDKYVDVIFITPKMCDKYVDIYHTQNVG